MSKQFIFDESGGIKPPDKNNPKYKVEDIVRCESEPRYIGEIIDVLQDFGNPPLYILRVIDKPHVMVCTSEEEIKLIK